MEIIRVNSREELDYLYSVSALTIEGLREDFIPDIMEILKNNTAVYRERAFIIVCIMGLKPSPSGETFR